MAGEFAAIPADWFTLTAILAGPPDGIEARAGASGLNAEALDEACILHRHLPWAEEVAQRRAGYALERLGAGEKPTARLAEGCGFDDAPTCDAALKSHFGLDMRRAGALQKATDFSLELPEDFRVEETLLYLGRDPGSLSLRRVENSTVLAAVLLGGRATTLKLVFPSRRGRTLHVTIAQSRRTDPNAAAHAVPVVARLLGLNSRSAALQRRAAEDPEIARLVRERRGLRLPLTAAPVDALTWSILGQQITLQFAYQLLRTCTELAGVRCPQGMRTMPTPERLASLSVDALTSRKHSRSKATYLLSAAAAVASGELPLGAMARGSAVEAYQRLTAARGIGPWTANYTMMRGLGFNDCVPLGDAGLRRALTRFMSLDTPPGSDQMDTLMTRFRPHRSLATYHLWRGSDDALG
ncbi:MAG: hypothetical protein AAF458_06695 [Pseudomonadota bacterium]